MTDKMGLRLEWQEQLPNEWSLTVPGLGEPAFVAGVKAGTPYFEVYSAVFECIDAESQMFASLVEAKKWCERFLWEWWWRTGEAIYTKSIAERYLGNEEDVERESLATEMAADVEADGAARREDQSGVEWGPRMNGMPVVVPEPTHPPVQPVPGGVKPPRRKWRGWRNRKKK